MALINNLPIFVEKEELVLDVEGTSHPVEKGVEITDHISKKPIEVNISGKIVKMNDVEASYILTEIKKLKDSGSIINYIGRNIVGKLQIRSFSTSHPNTVWGGCEFDMTLVEVRIAKPAYSPVEGNQGGTQQVEKGDNEKVYYTTKSGDTIWSLIWLKGSTTIKGDYRDLKREGAAENSWEENCQWVIDKNPHAFSKPGVPETMQVDKKLYLGDRK